MPNGKGHPHLPCERCGGQRYDLYPWCYDCYREWRKGIADKRKLAQQRHPSLTSERLYDAVVRQSMGKSSPGFCVKCGTEYDGYPPFSKARLCMTCKELTVYDAETIYRATI